MIFTGKLTIYIYREREEEKEKKVDMILEYLWYENIKREKMNNTSECGGAAQRE